MKKLRTVKSFRQLLRLLSCWYLYQVLQVNLFARFVKVKRTKIKFSKSRLPLKLVRLSCHSEEGSKLERKKKKIQTSHFTFSFFLFVSLSFSLSISFSLILQSWLFLTWLANVRMSKSRRTLSSSQCFRKKNPEMSWQILTVLMRNRMEKKVNYFNTNWRFNYGLVCFATWCFWCILFCCLKTLLLHGTWGR
jgi:hypothetical protein